MKKRIFALLIFTVVLIFASCGGKVQLSLNEEAITINIGEEKDLPAVFLSKKTAQVIYFSDNDNIATYIDGKVRGISAGDTKVTVQVKGEKQLKSCAVTVKDPSETEYTIEYRLAGGTNHADNPVKYKPKSLPITLKNPTREGFEFAGWYETNDFSGAKITAISSGMSGNKTYYAKWIELPSEYQITYVLNGGTNHADNPTKYTNENLPITLKNPHKDNAQFIGWFTSAAFTGTAVTQIAAGSTGNKTFYAKFEDIYTLSYNLDGGTNDSSNPVSYYATQLPLTLANASKTGYYFDGWYGTSDFSGDKITSLTVGASGNKTLYAKFIEIKTFEISYNLNGGSLNEGYPTTYQNIASLVLPLPKARTNWSFDGWYTTANFEAGTKVEEIVKGTEGNKEFYAKWVFTLAEVNVEYVLNGGTQNALNPAKILFNSLPVEFLAPIRTGYSFDGWFTDADFAEGTLVSSITEPREEDLKLYAKWTIIRYAIEYRNLFGSTAPSKVDYTVEDENFNLEDPTNCQTNFLGWYKEIMGKGGKVETITKGSTGKIIVFGFWEEAEYIITYHNIEDISNSDDLISSFSESLLPLALVEAEKDGYRFLGWKTAGNDDITEITLAGNLDLYADWEIIEYNITYNDELGKENNNPEKYTIITDTFTLINLADTPNYFTFEGWYTEASGKGQKVESIIKGTTENIVLYAYWKIIEFNITYVTNYDFFGYASIDLLYEALLSDVWDYHNNKYPGSIKENKMTFIHGAGKTSGFAGTWRNANYFNTTTVQDIKLTDKTAGKAVIENASYFINAEIYNNRWLPFFEEVDRFVTAVNSTQSVWTGVYYLRFINYFDTCHGNYATGKDKAMYKDFTTTGKYNASNDFELPVPGHFSASTTFVGWFDNPACTGEPITVIAKDSSFAAKTLYAKWECVYLYAITYHLNGGVNHESNPVSYRASDLAVALQNPTNAISNTIFRGWYKFADFSGDVITEINRQSGAVTSLYALWDFEYEVDYNLNGGIVGADIYPDKIYSVGFKTIDLLSLTKPTKEGFTFVGWYLDDAFQNPISEIDSAKNYTLWARWWDNNDPMGEYTLTFVLNGGAMTEADALEYNNVFDCPIQLPVPTKANYDFKGWYKDAAFSSSKVTVITFDESGDFTLYAKWEATKYNIDFVFNTGGSLADENGYALSELFLIDLHTFRGLSGNPLDWIHGPGKTSGFGGNWSATVIDAIDIFQASSSAATLFDITTGEGSPGKFINDIRFNHWYKLIVVCNDMTALRAGTAGYYNSVYGLTRYINGYLKNDNLYKWIGSENSDSKLHNKLWLPNISRSELGIKDTFTVEDGAITIPKAYNTDLNKIFVGWYTTADFQAGTEISVIPANSTASIKIYAKWEYEVIYELNGGVNALSNPSRYLISASLPIAINAPTRENYRFMGWYTNAGFTGSPVTEITTAGKLTLHAKWEQLYTITYNLNGGVNNEANIGEFIAGELDIDLDAPTREGFHFIGWYEHTDFSGSRLLEITETRNYILYAKWVAVSEEAYQVTFELDGGTINCDNPLEFEASDLPIVLEIPTKDNHIFLGWYSEWDEVDGFGGEVITEITDLGNCELFAKWAYAQLFTVTFTEGGDIPAVNVIENSTVSTPETPTKPEYLFDGWRIGSATGGLYNFTAPVTENLTLVAAWVKIDTWLAENVPNKINNDFTFPTFNGAISYSYDVTTPNVDYFNLSTGIMLKTSVEKRIIIVNASANNEVYPLTINFGILDDGQTAVYHINTNGGTGTVAKEAAEAYMAGTLRYKYAQQGLIGYGGVTLTIGSNVYFLGAGAYIPFNYNVATNLSRAEVSPYGSDGPTNANSGGLSYNTGTKAVTYIASQGYGALYHNTGSAAVTFNSKDTYGRVGSVAGYGYGKIIFRLTDGILKCTADVGSGTDDIITLAPGEYLWTPHSYEFMLGLFQSNSSAPADSVAKIITPLLTVGTALSVNQYKASTIVES